MDFEMCVWRKIDKIKWLIVCAKTVELWKTEHLWINSDEVGKLVWSHYGKGRNINDCS